MSEEDFEEEAKKRGWVRQERSRDEAESNKSSRGCFDSCFGRGGVRRKEARQSLESVREDEDDFEFRPHTQTQERETGFVSVDSSAPVTMQATPVETPIETPVETPQILTPAETPMETPVESPDRSIYATHP